MQKTGKNTRERIIDAAGELFAEKNYKSATIREIVEKAGVNLAAVNYHFGNKENLYVEVIRHIVHDVASKFPLDGADDTSLTPENRLREFIRIVMWRRHDPESLPWYGELFWRERMNPTSEGHGIIKKEIMKHKRSLENIVSELMADSTPQEIIKLCGQFVIGQVIFQGMIREEPVPTPMKEAPLGADEIEEISRYIAEFSLAGIARIDKMKIPHS